MGKLRRNIVKSCSLSEVNKLCVICLTINKPMVSIEHKLEKSSNEVTVYDLLCHLFKAKIPKIKSYPSQICQQCLEPVKEIRKINEAFVNSAEILEEYFKEKGVVLKNESENLNKDFQMKSEEVKTENSEIPTVELITHQGKYNINDLFIIEDEEEDYTVYQGFLNNLGGEVSAKFVNELISNKSGSTENNENREEIILIQKVNFDSDDDIDYNSDDFFFESESNFEKENYFDSDVREDKFDVPQSNPHINYDLNTKSNQNTENDKNINYKLNIKSNINKKFIQNVKSTTKTKLKITLKRKKKKIRRSQITATCDLCDKKFKSIANLTKHKRDCHLIGEQIQLCQICGFLARSKNALYNHISLKHQEKKYTCTICGKTYQTNNSLKVHTAAHENKRQHLCTICGKGFNYAVALEYHMRVHTGEKNFRCEYCDKSFSMKCALNRHLRTHTGARPYNCKYCDKSLRSKGELDCHEWTHTGFRPYHCVHCGKGFTKTFNLKMHLLGHKGPHECELCSKGFLEVNYLKLHMKLVHKISND